MLVSTLDPKAKQALRVIREKAVVSGWELKALSGLSPEELLEAVRTLIDSELIAASGDLLHPEGVLEAYFNLRPSARAAADFYLKFGAA